MDHKNLNMYTNFQDCHITQSKLNQKSLDIIFHFAVFILGLKILPVLYFGLSIFNLLPEQVQLTLAYNNTVKPLVVSPRAADVYDFVFVPNDALLGIKLYGSKLLDKQMVSINNQEILKLYPSSSSGRYVAVIGKSGKIT